MDKKRQLGTTDLQVAPLVLGGTVFGWTISEPDSFKVLDAFTGSGFNFIDTADVYSRWKTGNSGGESETILGNWVKKRSNRSEVLIGTKVGSDMGDGKNGLTKKYILQAAEDSLRRLQTDYIDLYQTHFDDLSTPVEATLEAYDALIKAGKVRWIGTSNMSKDRIRESVTTAKQRDLPLYRSLQPEYNLYARKQYEVEYERLCVEESLGVIPYFSLASGFLTGKYRTEADFSKSARGGGMKKYMDDRGMAILATMDSVAARHQTDLAAVAIAWLLARPSLTAPIASATSVEQLAALMKATRLELSKDDVAELDRASDWKQAPVAG